MTLSRILKHPSELSCRVGAFFLLLAFRAVTGGTDDCDCVMTVGIAARRESCDGGGVISVEIGRLFFLVGDDVVFVGDDTGMGRGW